MKYPHFWVAATRHRKRIYSTLFILILAVLTTITGTMFPLSEQDALEVYKSLNQTVEQGLENETLIQDIFVNNFSLALLMFIPIVGLFFGLYVLFSTGQAFRAIFDIQIANGIQASAVDISAEVAILSLVAVGLVFLLEYASYAIGMTESIWLARRLWQRRWRELKWTALLIGTVALLLIIGAIVETYTLSIGI
ncbi:MAG: hypothetical protein GX799_05170 [Crenarchaeota archaeon]|nr:hypothetical protein [Thermoproteota archaeon]